jgi:hypothetical protein
MNVIQIFEIQKLINHYTVSINKKFNKESYVITVNDHNLFEEIRKNLVIPSNQIIKPVETEKPFSILYHIGEYKFFYFRDQDGRVHNVVIKGTDIFDMTSVVNDVVFVGQRFITQVKSDKEVVCRREIVYILPSMQEKSIRIISDKLSKMFYWPQEIEIQYYRSFMDARNWPKHPIRFPNPVVLKKGYLATIEKPEPPVRYTRYRYTVERVTEKYDGLD